MLKLRLQRIGRKRRPFYRLVIMTDRARRDGCPVDYVGYYDPILKQSNFQTDKVVKWLGLGAQPTVSVKNLLKKSKIIN